ncbi:MAG: hypothetical protein EPO08_08180 [Rhodospirillaceae bacterium]|nr:MAG: hypothetical protein EPO08_08180 [Rhodospirillaceae bacterium]
MYRRIYLIKRKPGLTHRQFRDHYETKHRLLGEKAINGYGLSYERYYLYPMTSDGAESIYDAVMQLRFPDRDTSARCSEARRNNPELAKMIDEDELNFIARESCMQFEAQDSFSKLQPLPPSDDVFRVVWFARHRSGMTHEQCRAYYENKHRLLGEYLINGYAYTYDRYYLHKIAPDAPEPYYTFIMEMKLPTRDSFDQINANIVADPTLRRFIVEDEARYIDRASTVYYRAEVCASALEPLGLVPAG